MKKVLILLVSLLTGALLKAQTPGGPVPPTATQDFTTRYPSITAKKWKQDNAGQYFARFSLHQNPAQAYYDKNGNWVKTDISIKCTQHLPIPVKSAFHSSEYASWRIEKMQEVDSAGQKLFYIIAHEMQMSEEGGSTGDTRRLTFSLDGKLLGSETIE